MQEETKEITLGTPITKLEFPQAWRLRKYVAEYNATLDKNKRIITVKDLLKVGLSIANIKGIGPETNYQIQSLLLKSKLA